MVSEQKTFEQLGVEEVLELVKSGQMTAQEAIEIEQKGKNRKTLVGALVKMLESDESENEDQQTETNKVRLLKNIKYKRQWHYIGEEIEIEADDRKAFVKAGIIEG